MGIIAKGGSAAVGIGDLRDDPVGRRLVVGVGQPFASTVVGRRGHVAVAIVGVVGLIALRILLSQRVKQIIARRQVGIGCGGTISILD